jgi:hypothetical protein
MSGNHLKYNSLLSKMFFQRGLGDPGIGTQIAPLVKSERLSHSYMVVDRAESGVKTDIKRAPGQDVKRLERKGRKLETFNCVDHALIEEIPHEYLHGSEELEIIQEEKQTANDVLRKIEDQHERDVHGIAWANNVSGFEGKFGASNVIDVANDSTAWDSAGGNIKKDVLNIRLKMYEATGKRPNTIVLPNEVFNVISTADNEIRDSLKYTTGGPVTMDKLASYFEMERVLIPMFLVDDPEPGSEDKSLLYTGDHVGMYYVDPSQSRKKQTFASTFYWDSSYQRFLEVSTGFNRSNKSHEVEVSAYYDVKLIDGACGGALANVLAG